MRTKEEAFKGVRETIEKSTYYNLSETETSLIAIQQAVFILAEAMFDIRDFLIMDSSKKGVVQ